MWRWSRLPANQKKTQTIFNYCNAVNWIWFVLSFINGRKLPSPFYQRSTHNFFVKQVYPTSSSAKGHLGPNLVRKLISLKRFCPSYKLKRLKLKEKHISVASVLLLLWLTTAAGKVGIQTHCNYLSSAKENERSRWVRRLITAENYVAVFSFLALKATFNMNTNTIHWLKRDKQDNKPRRDKDGEGCRKTETEKKI